MPNCCRIDTFMSGKPDSVFAARDIAPPWPRQIRGAAPSLPSPLTGEDREGERSDIAVHLAETPKAAKATAAAIPLLNCPCRIGVSRSPQTSGNYRPG